MGLDADRGDEPQGSRVVGKDPDDPRAALDLGVEPRERVGRPDLGPVALRERCKGADVSRVVVELVSNLRERSPERLDDLSELAGDVDLAGLGEDRPDGCGDHLGLALRDPREHVAHLRNRNVALNNSALTL